MLNMHKKFKPTPNPIQTRLNSEKARAQSLRLQEREQARSVKLQFFFLRWKPTELVSRQIGELLWGTSVDVFDELKLRQLKGRDGRDSRRWIWVGKKVFGKKGDRSESGASCSVVVLLFFGRYETLIFEHCRPSFWCSTDLSFWI